jgi:surface antigen
MRNRLTAAFLAAALAFSYTGAAQAETSWQCAPFARFFSGIKIFGDAWTWWEQASGKYAKDLTPDAGAVLVFKPYGAMKSGHVAVVSQVLTDRIIQVTHANWGGARGKVENDVTVVDVSDAGDWSKVKVWYDPSGDLGSTTYPTFGFIHAAAQQMAETAQTAFSSATARVR